MGKFFNGKVKKKRTIETKYILIGAGILIAVILVFIISKAIIKKSREIVIIPKDKIDIQINDEYPQTKDLFSKIKNYNSDLLVIDYNGLNVTEIGQYTVLVNGNNSVYEIQVNVIDTTPPKLSLKENLTIAVGQLYDIKDFVVECVDNSNAECILEYEKNETYSENGTYEIIIKAKDINDNYSESQKTTLIIGDGNNNSNPKEPVDPGENQKEPIDPIPQVTCEYGNLTVHEQHDFPIAIIVGDKETGCALNRDLWDNKEIQDKVYDFYIIDNNKLRTELQPIIKQNFPSGASIVVHPKFLAALNQEQKGLVGYGIYVEVYIAQSNTKESIDNKNNLKLAYYIKDDGTRVYDTNIYKFN